MGLRLPNVLVSLNKSRNSRPGILQCNGPAGLFKTVAIDAAYRLPILIGRVYQLGLNV